MGLCNDSTTDEEEKKAKQNEFHIYIGYDAMSGDATDHLCI